MQINAAVLALVLLFIPGILCFGIVSNLASRRNRDNIVIILQIFMYGVSSYMILAMFDKIFPCAAQFLGINVKNVALLNPSSIEKAGIDPLPIAWASAIGIIQGLIISVNINKSLLMRACRFCGITNRFSDPDAWSFLLNSDDTNNWVTLRHKERGHIYQGYVRSFSGGDKDRELIMTDVQVYDLDTAEHVGDIPILYLSFKKEDLLLEFGVKQPETRSSDQDGDA